mmetsp:Transcript_13367/g.31646  ORF Transcript_13367/g.31646 Transcript_13367/m.31646 type:complete len:260 (-) Transcript_13367:762-1541(-)
MKGGGGLSGQSAGCRLRPPRFPRLEGLDGEPALGRPPERPRDGLDRVRVPRGHKAHVARPAAAVEAQPHPRHLRAGGVLPDKEPHAPVPLQQRRGCPLAAREHAACEVSDHEAARRAVVRGADAREDVGLRLEPAGGLERVDVEAEALELEDRAGVRLDEARVGEVDDGEALPGASDGRRAVGDIAVKPVPFSFHVELSNTINVQKAAFVITETYYHAVPSVVCVYVSLRSILAVDLYARERKTVPVYGPVGTTNKAAK